MPEGSKVGHEDDGLQVFGTGYIVPEKKKTGNVDVKFFGFMSEAEYELMAGSKNCELDIENMNEITEVKQPGSQEFAHSWHPIAEPLCLVYKFYSSHNQL